MHSESGFLIAPNWPEIEKKKQKKNSNVTISKHDVIVNLFFVVFLFHFSILVICPSFMSIPSLVMELPQVSFIRNSPEIRKLEIPQSEFCPISGDWDTLSIPIFAQISLMEC